MTELRRVSIAMLLVFVLIALAATYWSVVGADALRQRDDNPRLVERQVVAQRGAIYDRQGLLLATTTVDYDGEGLRRLYPHPEAAPVVGYYSLRYGVGGIEAAYDALLGGELGPTPGQVWLRDLLHEPLVGGDVRLTLDLEVQRMAAQLLADRAGAIIVATLPDGAIRALVSAPTFDPNALGRSWPDLITSPDAPLLNRATQGVYQPGGLLQTLVLASALAHQESIDDAVLGSTRPVEVNGLTLTCGAPAPAVTLTLRTAYLYGCPAAFALVGSRLPAEDLDALLWRAGFTATPSLFGLNTAGGDSPLPLVYLPDQQTFTAALMGQGGLTISPLQALDVAVAVANGGNVPSYHLIEATRLPGEAWQPVPTAGLSRAVLTAETAAVLQEIMLTAANEGVTAAAGRQSAFRVRGHAATAYAGPDATPLQWFIGMVTFGQEAVVTVVVLEDAPAPAEAAEIGGQILDTAARNFSPPVIDNDTP